MKQLKFVMMACLALLLFGGCNSYKKQAEKFHKFAYDYPGELAKDCAKQFPCKDSIGEVKTDSTHKANNVNYKGTIDSLQSKYDSLAVRLAADAADKGNPCASVASKYQNDMSALGNQLKSLQGKYEACKSDTVYRTRDVYRRDQAMEKVLSDKLDTKSDSLKLVNALLTDAKSAASTRLWIIIALGAGVIVLAVLKFKSII